MKYIAIALLLLVQAVSVGAKDKKPKPPKEPMIFGHVCASGNHGCIVIKDPYAWNGNLYVTIDNETDQHITTGIRFNVYGSPNEVMVLHSLNMSCIDIPPHGAGLCNDSLDIYPNTTVALSNISVQADGLWYQTYYFKPGETMRLLFGWMHTRMIP